MTDPVTDFDITEKTDNDESKNTKFEYKRHKIIKVYIYI
jgi:hypothetical protein